MKFKLSENIQVLPGDTGNAYSSSKHLYHAIKVTEDKTLLSNKTSLLEAIDMEFEEDKQGGMVILSTDVNALPQSENKIIDWVIKKVKTLNNRLRGTKKIDDIAQEHDLVGWTVGHFLSGRYTAKNGKAFGENSLSVEIIGIDTNTLIEIATELCEVFEQETVLVKNYNDKKIYLINSDK